jgi:hypothetical protein
MTANVQIALNPANVWGQTGEERVPGRFVAKDECASFRAHAATLRKSSPSLQQLNHPIPVSKQTK